jgi:hypothetical protein
MGRECGHARVVGVVAVDVVVQGAGGGQGSTRGQEKGTGNLFWGAGWRNERHQERRWGFSEKAASPAQPFLIMFPSREGGGGAGLGGVGRGGSGGEDRNPTWPTISGGVVEALHIRDTVPCAPLSSSSSPRA